jgi:peptidylprolyl isomerase
MAQAQKGSRVRIDFTGTLEDGTVFDTTRKEGAGDCGCDDCGCEEGPMELVLGEDSFFTLIEEALVGMAVGEKKTVLIPTEEAFGDYDEEKVFSIPRDQIPADLQPEVGQELELTDEDDEAVMVTVLEVDEDGITLDANHPLAGENLSYEVELLEIL